MWKSFQKELYPFRSSENSDQSEILTNVKTAKVFAQKVALTHHERIYSGQRPFVCNECGKAFRDNATVLEHKKIHTDEKPYWYDECRKGFRKSSTLITHQRCIQEINPIAVVNVENLSGIHPLLDIRRLIVEINPTDVMTVGKPI